MAEENVSTTPAEAVATAQANTEAVTEQGKQPETPVMAEPKGEEAQPKQESAAPEGEPKKEAPVMAEEGGEKPKEEAPEQPPTDYFAEVKLPEGYELDRELAPKASELFGKYKLPKEAAQEFIDFAAGMRQKEATAAQQSQAESIRRMASEIRNRPKFKEELPIVRLGIANLAKDNPKIRELYNDPVFGNMPELYDIALAVGRRFESEGQLLSGGRDSGQPRSFLDGMYPSMNNKQE